MTTRAEAESILNTVFVTAWGGVTPSTLLNVELEGEGEWCRVSIEDGPSIQETMAVVGDRTVEARATLVAEIYVKRNAGTSRADALAQVFEDAFEMKTLSGCHLRAASRLHVGEVNQWHKVVSRVPFTYYRRK